MRMRYAIEQRLRMLDFLLHQYGSVNRSALEDFFGVSTPQASADIAEYIRLAPNNAAYDKSRKAYIRTDAFKRVWN